MRLHNMKTIAVVNQKGGVGKSTTAAALASGLSLRGFNVLSIDLDAQSNLTYALGAAGSNKTALGVLTGETTATEARTKTYAGDIIPASKALSAADSILTDTGKEYRLREALDSIKPEYDFIVIDSPPALGILTVNALTAADSVIIPAQADIFSIQGIEQLSHTIRQVKKYTNPDLNIKGILLTRYNPRAVLSRDAQGITTKLAAGIGTKVFSATIREAIAVKEAQITKEGLFTYAPKAKVTADYGAFIDELLDSESEAAE